MMMDTEEFKLKKERIFSFRGCMTPVVTPYHEDGTVDIGQIGSYADYLGEMSIPGLYILGTTGEGLLQNLSDKIRVAEEWKKSIDHVEKKYGYRMVSILHISSMSLPEMIEMIQIARHCQMDGIALLQPIYYKIENPIKLTKYFNMILGDLPLPFLFYHNKLRTGGFNYDFNLFLKETLERVPQFCAVKFSDNNIADLSSAVHYYGDQVKFFAGMNDICLPSRSIGVDGAIVSSLNLPDCIRAYNSMLDHYDRGQVTEALKQQRIIDTRCDQLKSDGQGNFIGALKSALTIELKSRGLKFGNSRAPVL